MSSIIGLMGLNFGSANLGCAALAISFYKDLTHVLRNLDIDCKVIVVGAPTNVKEFENIRYPIEFVEYHLSKPMTMIQTVNALDGCNIVFDFTEGDSFADIYGRVRFYRSVVLKRIMEKKHIPLVLGPQTYGPFTKPDCRLIARKIIEDAFKVYSRDDKSKEYLDIIGVKRETYVSTDVAFRLPYKKENKGEERRINIGLNVSGLLWEDSISNKNMLGLTVNYVDYMRRLIEGIQDSKYHIFLIPHVGTDIDGIESDYGACYKLHKEFENCTLMEGFADPISAKTALSRMDIVVAARMHASIGAFSSGVFTIPFAYSRKFEGYYGRLSYPILVDGTKESTDDAVEKTLTYIKEYEQYAHLVEQSRGKAERMLDNFYNDISQIIKQVMKKDTTKSV